MTDELRVDPRHRRNFILSCVVTAAIMVSVLGTFLYAYRPAPEPQEREMGKVVIDWIDGDSNATAIEFSGFQHGSGNPYTFNVEFLTNGSYHLRYAETVRQESDGWTVRLIHDWYATDEQIREEWG
jgi:hypothetical protein